VHVPAEHTFSAGQAVPHLPQLARSLSSVEQVAPHIVCVAGHATIASADASPAVTVGSLPTHASRICAARRAAPRTSTTPTVFPLAILKNLSREV
jgi:hypothetical protein